MQSVVMRDNLMVAALDILTSRESVGGAGRRGEGQEVKKSVSLSLSRYLFQLQPCNEQ
jgi:hypothetical protein